MTSCYAELLIKLQQRLAPVLRYIELDLGQLDVYEYRPAVAFPCGLFRFTGQYQKHQLNSQWNNFTMSLKLGFDHFGDTSNITPLHIRKRALEYLEVEQRIYLLLQNWYADGLLSNPFSRVNDGDQYTDDGMRLRLINYSGMFVDGSLAQQLTTP